MYRMYSEETMKKIEAIIKHARLNEVRDSLYQIGVQGMTLTEVKGFGRQKGHMEVYRCVEYEVTLLPKVKIEAIVADDQVEFAISIITHAARTGAIGDGKIFVLPVEEVVRISSGELAEAAV